MAATRPVWIVPTIVVGQWLVTSLWFAANGVTGSPQGLCGSAGGGLWVGRTLLWSPRGFAGKGCR